MREVFGKQTASGGRSLSPADNDSDDDLEEEEGVSGLTIMLNKSRELLTVKKTVANQNRVDWAGAGLVVGSTTLSSLGDAVLVQPSQPGVLPYVGRISSLYSGPEGATVHLVWYGRAEDTVLADTAEAGELVQRPAPPLCHGEV